MFKFRSELQGLKRLVVKVGSNVITKPNGKLDMRTMRVIVEDIVDLVDYGVEVVLVSSGAVSVGKQFLKKHIPKKDAIDLQHSASSIGQPKLINIYSRIFDEHQRICSQILLTHDDFRNRKRFLHAKQTCEVLLQNKIIPILNENDSVSYNEISLGDNDHLAAQTAQMIGADALLVITSAQGLFDKDPSLKDAKLLRKIEYGQNINHIEMSTKTLSGTGGMESKVHAVTKVTHFGIQAIISSKNNERIILDPLTKELGTYFCPKKTYDPELRKAWLLSMKKQFCSIEIDRGAYNALRKGKSLLPMGILKVNGIFFKGDCIDICFKGHPFASGICEYNASEIKLIKRKHSQEINQILGFSFGDEVIHTTNLVLDNGVKNENNERVSS